jgi:heat shock transcription factor
MYGFHKKVGLSDNSMKASETKAKAPSEYFNKYFKRGRPELLWLIQKPKNPTAGPKRKREDDGKGDSDDERKYVQDTGGGGYVEELAVRGNDQMAMIPRSEYNSLRVEVRQLQDQQKLISNVLSTIKRQNEELYSRATSFQALHDRHENSINAILTFLATFYNRSLEGNTNGLNLADMFPAARQQPHGNVVDVDDFPATEMSMNKSPHLQRNKRPLALLPAPPAGHPDLLSALGGRATTISPTTRPLASPITRPASRQQTLFKNSVPQNRQTSTANTAQVQDDPYAIPLKVESPSNTTPLSGNDIMSAIQDANASAGTTSQAPQFDFPAALSNYQTQNGNVPLTAQERNNVLSMMAGDTSASTTNNALTNPNPPEMQRLMRDLSQYQATQKQLEMLQQMSDEQNSRVQSLQERLQPLSPSGQIPGLSENEYFGNTNGLGDPGQYDLDLDSFVQDQDYFPSNTDANLNGGTTHDTGNGLPDFNFDNATPDLTGTNPFDGTSADAFNFNAADTNHLNVDGDAGFNDNRIESVSSNATSPAATVEEVEDESRKRSPKRRKQ